MMSEQKASSFKPSTLTNSSLKMMSPDERTALLGSLGSSATDHQRCVLNVNSLNDQRSSSQEDQQRALLGSSDRPLVSNSSDPRCASTASRGEVVGRPLHLQYSVDALLSKNDPSIGKILTLTKSFYFSQRVRVRPKQILRFFEG